MVNLTPSSQTEDFKKLLLTSIQDLEKCLNTMVQLKGQISNFMPLFDIEFLKADQTIDIKKIDFTYLAKMGHQLIADNHSLANEAAKINQDYESQITSLRQITTLVETPEDVLLDAHTRLFTMTENVLRWLDKHSSLIVNGIAADITQHYHNAKIASPTGN